MVTGLRGASRSGEAPSPAELRPGVVYRGVVTQAYDGDTITVRLRSGAEVTLRPDDYDSAEMRGVGEREKDAAARARAAVLAATSKGVSFVCEADGKGKCRQHMGRTIAHIKGNGGVDLGIIMVQHAMIEQRRSGATLHSIPWAKGQTRRLEWFPEKGR